MGSIRSFSFYFSSVRSRSRRSSVPFLAAARHGRTDTGVGLFAFGHDGEGGRFLLARMYPVLAGTELWFVIVSTTGAITFVYGAYVALLKHDLKGLLAYSTVSHLGLITLLFGLDTPMATVAAVFHIINHAIFKASLFMAAGSSTMKPVRATCAGWAAFSAPCRERGARHPGRRIDGGRAASERVLIEGNVLYGGGSTSGVRRGQLILPVVATIGGMLGVAYSVRFVWDVFFDRRRSHAEDAARAGELDAAAGGSVGRVWFSLSGSSRRWSVGPILKFASDAVLPGPVPEIKLAVWHGFNLPLAITVVAFGLGVFAVHRGRKSSMRCRRDIGWR